MADALYHSLKEANPEVIRDKNALEYKGFISDFIGEIGQGKCVVVAISRKCVRSPFCMFELYAIARNSNFDKHRSANVAILQGVAQCMKFSTGAKIFTAGNGSSLNLLQHSST